MVNKISLINNHIITQHTTVPTLLVVSKYAIIPTLFSPPHVPWCDILKNILENGCKVLKISGNGLWLVEAVRQAIDKDLDIKNSYNAQARKLWMEIKNRILFYNDFAPNQTSTSILKTIYDYLKKRSLYTLPIIDIMLPACATALNVNIRVWQNDNGFKNILQFDVYPTPSLKTIHLLYTRTLNAEGIPDASLDPNNLCHHYDALILKSATDDNEKDDGPFPSDEEYMGNSLTQETLVSTTATTTTSITSSDILTYSNDIEYQVEDVPYH